MHVPNPASFFRFAWSTYSYYRSGVKVEGEAWLCTSDHAPFIFVGPEGASERGQAPQHVDVALRFWNRRSDPVSVIEVIDVDLPQRTAVLAVAAWKPFEPVRLPEGDEPQVREFVLVPRDAPDGRVEASYGDRLVLQFRQTRGSERWARPRADLVLKQGARFGTD